MLAAQTLLCTSNSCFQCALWVPREGAEGGRSRGDKQGKVPEQTPPKERPEDTRGSHLDGPEGH